jgi:hypothetical protein
MSEGYVRGNAKPGTCLKCERDVEQISTHLGIEHGISLGETAEVIEDLMLRIRHLENQVKQLQNG